jgi:hypothetical protein
MVGRIYVMSEIEHGVTACVQTPRGSLESQIAIDEFDPSRQSPIQLCAQNSQVQKLAKHSGLNIIHDELIRNFKGSRKTFIESALFERKLQA